MNHRQVADRQVAAGDGYRIVVRNLSSLYWIPRMRRIVASPRSVLRTAIRMCRLLLCTENILQYLWQESARHGLGAAPTLGSRCFLDAASTLVATCLVTIGITSRLRLVRCTRHLLTYTMFVTYLPHADVSEPVVKTQQT